MRTRVNVRVAFKDHACAERRSGSGAIALQSTPVWSMLMSRVIRPALLVRQESPRPSPGGVIPLSALTRAPLALITGPAGRAVADRTGRGGRTFRRGKEIILASADHTSRDKRALHGRQFDRGSTAGLGTG